WGRFRTSHSSRSSLMTSSSTSSAAIAVAERGPLRKSPISPSGWPSPFRFRTLSSPSKFRRISTVPEWITYASSCGSSPSLNMTSPGRNLRRVRLESGLGPDVEQHRIEPALDEADDLGRRDAEAVLPPPLTPHAAVGPDAHERHAERRHRPRERLRRRVFDLLLRELQRVLHVGEVRHQLVGLGELHDGGLVVLGEKGLDAGRPDRSELAVAGLRDRGA